MWLNKWQILTFILQKLSLCHKLILLYADNVLLLSRMPLGLHRALNSFATHCDTEHLTITYHKIKVFGRYPKKRLWAMEGNKIEQVNTFIYFGGALQEYRSNAAHCNLGAMCTDRTMYAILRSFHSKGDLCIPAALKLFQAKVVAQLL